MALYGRQPNLLRDFESPSASESNETGSGHSVARLREIAVATMMEGTAADRLSRALRSRTRIAGESLNLKPGDLVDFYRAPFTKDISGWLGPAKVVNTTEVDNGNIDVKRQGRMMGGNSLVSLPMMGGNS